MTDGWTPGPLKVEYENDVGPDDRGFREWWSIRDSNGNECGQAKKKTDALLYGAAPDMAEALEGLSQFAWTAVRTDCEESRLYLQSLIDAARAALAKAREQSIPRFLIQGGQPCE